MASERDKRPGNPVKHIPKDAQVIMSILKELGISEYEPRVINQLLEFTYRKFYICRFCKTIIIYTVNRCRICYVHLG